MRLLHSFHIPYLEHVTDIEGLLSYLGEKVAVGNFCLACGESGKMFHSLEAVRQHMVLIVLTNLWIFVMLDENRVSEDTAWFSLMGVKTNMHPSTTMAKMTIQKMDGRR